MIAPKVLRAVRSWPTARKISIPSDFPRLPYLRWKRPPRSESDTTEAEKEAADSKATLNLMTDALVANDVLEELDSAWFDLPPEIFEALEGLETLRKIRISNLQSGSRPALRKLVERINLEELDLFNTKFWDLPASFLPLLTGVDIVASPETVKLLSQMPQIQKVNLAFPYDLENAEEVAVEVFNDLLTLRRPIQYSIIGKYSPNMELRFEHLSRRNLGEPYNPNLVKPIVYSELVLENQLAKLRAQKSSLEGQIPTQTSAEVEREIDLIRRRRYGRGWDTETERREASIRQDRLQEKSNQLRRMEQNPQEQQKIQEARNQLKVVNAEIRKVSKELEDNRAKPPKEGQRIWKNEDLKELDVDVQIPDAPMTTAGDETIRSVFLQVRALLPRASEENLVDDVAQNFGLELEEVEEILGDLLEFPEA